MKCAFAIVFSLAATLLIAADEPYDLEPTYADVAYGPHKLNVLDFWQAEGEGPRPLFVYIHGGGWTGGDKKMKTANYEPFLKRGISCAAINYRLTPKNPLPAPVYDAARALQFLRTKAGEWKIDPKHIGLNGGSAGACTAMWLLFHDDLANPDATDPVLRESTRVCAAAVDSGQTSIDPKVIDIWLGPSVVTHSMICSAVGERTIQGAMKNYDKYHSLYAEFSPINHVDAKDPPLFMYYRGDITVPATDPGQAIHHAVFGIKMKEKCDRVGHECHLLIPGHAKSRKYNAASEFMFAKLLAK